MPLLFQVGGVEKAIVQGLLLAWDYGPVGLVGGDGKPDGYTGPKTQAALSSFRVTRGWDAGTGVDAGVWHALLLAV